MPPVTDRVWVTTMLMEPAAPPAVALSPPELLRRPVMTTRAADSVMAPPAWPVPAAPLVSMVPVTKIALPGAESEIP